MNYKYLFTEKTIKDHTIFETNTSERISNIAKTHRSALEEFDGSVKTYTTKINSLSEEQKVFFEGFLNDLKKRDEAIKTDLSKSLTELDEIFKVHSKLNNDYMENLSKEIENSHLVYKNHSTLLKENLKNISTETADSFTKAIQVVKSDADQRKALEIKKAEAIETMMKAMKQIEAINIEEQECNKNLTTVVGNLETTKDKFANDVEANIVKPLDSHTLEREESRQRFHKGISTVQMLNESDKVNCESKVNKSTKTLNDFTTERTDLFQTTLASVNEKCGNIINELTSCTKMISDKKEESNSLIEHNCQDVRQVVTAECLRLKEYHYQINAYSHSLSDNMQQYSSEHVVSMKDCVAQLDDFQEKELQTYTPTGETPMKKEFKYPRILACTAPHNTIIKRLREENEWSDLDATTVYDEVCLDFFVFIV